MILAVLTTVVEGRMVNRHSSVSELTAFGRDWVSLHHFYISSRGHPPNTYCII